MDAALKSFVKLATPSIGMIGFRLSVKGIIDRVAKLTTATVGRDGPKILADIEKLSNKKQEGAKYEVSGVSTSVREDMKAIERLLIGSGGIIPVLLDAIRDSVESYIEGINVIAAKEVEQVVAGGQ